MNHEPRTIAFLCDLRHPPVAPDPAALQKVHNRLFEGGAPIYPSFQVTDAGAVFSRPVSTPAGLGGPPGGHPGAAAGSPGGFGGTAVSSATFLADRMLFQEELSGLTVEEFTDRVRGLVELVAELRSIQVLVAQIVTVRTLVNPRRFQDSRTFLKDGVFGFGEELACFDREPHLFGLRLVFPPEGENQNAFNLRIESFAQDPRSLFLENQGSFGPTVGPQGVDALAANIRATYDFLVERALTFLGPFDAHQEA